RVASSQRRRRGATAPTVPPAAARNLRSSGADMRVLHIVAPGEIGGLERVVQLLTRAQASAGQETHVALVLEPGSAGHALVANLADGGVTPHPIAIPGRAYFRERRLILELTRRLHPDVVHTHGYRPDVV